MARIQLGVRAFLVVVLAVVVARCGTSEMVSSPGEDVGATDDELHVKNCIAVALDGGVDAFRKCLFGDAGFPGIPSFDGGIPGIPGFDGGIKPPAFDASIPSFDASFPIPSFDAGFKFQQCATGCTCPNNMKCVNPLKLTCPDPFAVCVP